MDTKDRDTTICKDALTINTKVIIDQTNTKQISAYLRDTLLPTMHPRPECPSEAEVIKMILHIKQELAAPNKVRASFLLETMT